MQHGPREGPMPDIFHLLMGHKEHAKLTWVLSIRQNGPLSKMFVDYLCRRCANAGAFSSHKVKLPPTEAEGLAGPAWGIGL